MSQFEDQYDRIEDYLKNRLSVQDRLAFESQMAAKEDLREEVAIQKMAIGVLDHAYMQDMSKLISNEIARKSLSQNWKWIGLMVLIGVSVLAFVVYDNKKEGDGDKKILKKEALQTIGLKEEIPLAKQSQTEGSPSEKNSHSINTPQNIPSVKINPTIEGDQNSRNSIAPIIKEKQEEKTVIVSNTNKENNIKIPEKPEKIVVEQVMCDYVPKVKVTNKIADLGKDNGELIVYNLTKDKLLYSINKSEFDQQNNFTNLKKGSYQLMVEKGSCKYDIGVFEVKESFCNSNKDYSFNINQESEFVLDSKSNDIQVINIYNKIGNLVLEKTLQANEDLTWDGLYSNGQEAVIGLHVIYVKHLNGEICKYNVVISF
jgi:hypothetical protein